MYAWPPPEKPVDYSLVAGLRRADNVEAVGEQPAEA